MTNGAYRNGVGAQTAAKVDGGYEPISPTTQGETGVDMVYTVRAGETLGSIALAVWGDASLWSEFGDRLSGRDFRFPSTGNQYPNAVLRLSYRPRDSVRRAKPG